MTALNPVRTIGAQFDEHLARLGEAQPQRAPRPRRRHAGGGAIAARRGSADAISASIVRRHVPARADRHGVFQQSAPGHRRRADHRARCHHASADPGADRRHAAPARHRGHLHHPRPAACRATVRRRDRDVCRPRRRKRSGARRAVDTRRIPIRAACSSPIRRCAPSGARFTSCRNKCRACASSQTCIRLPFRAAMSAGHERIAAATSRRTLPSPPIIMSRAFAPRRRGPSRRRPAIALSLALHGRPLLQVEDSAKALRGRRRIVRRRAQRCRGQAGDIQHRRERIRRPGRRKRQRQEHHCQDCWSGWSSRRPDASCSTARI